MTTLLSTLIESNILKTHELFPNQELNQKDDSKTSALLKYESCYNLKDVSSIPVPSAAPLLIEAPDSQVSQQLSLIPEREYTPTDALVRMKDPRIVPTPEWHAPWKLMRVISGHLGPVRAIAVDPGNEWFATAGGDRIIKIWDMASVFFVNLG